MLDSGFQMAQSKIVYFISRQRLSQPVKLVDHGVYLLMAVFRYMAQRIDLYKTLRFRSNVARAD